VPAASAEVIVLDAPDIDVVTGDGLSQAPLLMSPSVTAASASPDSASAPAPVAASTRLRAVIISLTSLANQRSVLLDLVPNFIVLYDNDPGVHQSASRVDSLALFVFFYTQQACLCACVACSSRLCP
jgi:hypothetical protein